MDKQTTINGRTFSFGYIPPTRAIGVEVILAKVLGGPLIKVLFGDKGQQAEKKDMGVVGAAVMAAVSEKLTEEEVQRVMSVVFEYASCEGQRINIDECFSNGRHKDMWMAFLYGLKFNFSDFIPATLSASAPGAVVAK